VFNIGEVICDVVDALPKLDAHIIIKLLPSTLLVIVAKAFGE
jgi:hypothetical protein